MFDKRDRSSTRHTLAAVVTAVASIVGAPSSASASQAESSGDLTSGREVALTTNGAIDLASQSALLSAKAVIDAHRSEEARKWSEHFAQARQGRESLRANERATTLAARTARSLALEESFRRQTVEGYRAPSAADSLAAALTALGNGAQSSTAQIGVATLEALKQVAIQNDKGLVEMINTTAVTAEERLEAAKMVTSACSGMPMPPSSSSGAAGAKQGASAPPPAASATPAPIQTPARQVSATIPPRSETAGSAAASVRHSPGEGGGFGVASPVVDKILGPYGGPVAGRVLDRLSERFPEVGRFMCKAGNITDRLIDGIGCTPIMGAGNGMPSVSPTGAQMMMDCNARANWELKQNNKECDAAADQAKAQQAERDAQYQREKGSK